MQKTLYILAGPNGAGKTTAAYTFLPDMLGCKVFINADEIARGLSPFDVDAVAFEAGRIMLNEIDKHLAAGNNFAIETTLSTKFYIQLTKAAQIKGYKVVLLFLYLPNAQTAEARVKSRVEAGGHNIPVDVIKRRYERGLINFFWYFIDLVDEWYFVDNENIPLELARKELGNTVVHDQFFTNLVAKYGTKA